jgi:hypothetical protein
MNYLPKLCSIPKSHPHKSSNKEWQSCIDALNHHIVKNVIVNDCLPVGTVLYHGSLDSNLDFYKYPKLFFGIDVVISLWYILELRIKQLMLDNSKDNKEKLKELHVMSKIGTLYEFVVIKPIPVHFLYDLYVNANKDATCKSGLTACIHPQIAFHGNPGDTTVPYDIGIEVSLRI